MTTYYVGPGGNNGSAGTSYATRWLTLAKALGAAGIASTDTLYITPATYREAVSVAMTSPVATTNIIGDVDGSHTSGTPGNILWSAYTTNDTTAPSASPCLDLAGRDFLAFSNICFLGGSNTASCVTGATANPTDITFTDCFFTNGVSGGGPILITTAAGVASNWTFNRCTIHGLGGNTAAGAVLINYTRHSADYDANIVFTNCLIHSFTACIAMQSAGAGAGFAGGVKAKNCTFVGVHGIRALDANIASTGTVGADVKNSFFYCQLGVRCSTATAVITEDHNVFACGTPRTNVAAGTGSVTSYAPLYHYGQERHYYGQVRPAFTPTSGSPLLGFTTTSPPSVDLLNRDRPSGGASTSSAAGALERHEFGTKETGTIDTGGLAIRLTGPGDHWFPIPVASGHSTTVTLKVNYDANHATTNPPQAELVANPTLGYAGETVTAAASTGTFLTLTFAAFTPTAAGYVFLRLRSRSAAANGFAIFDTVSVT